MEKDPSHCPCCWADHPGWRVCWEAGLLGRVLQAGAPGLAWSVASLSAPTSRPQVSTLTSSGLLNGERVAGFSAAWDEDWKERGGPVRNLGVVRESWLLRVGGLEVPPGGQKVATPQVRRVSWDHLWGVWVGRARQMGPHGGLWADAIADR